MATKTAVPMGVLMETATVPRGDSALQNGESRLDPRRAECLTGSAIAAIFGHHPYMTEQRVQREKLGLAEPTEPSLLMRKGTALEPFAVERWEEETGRLTKEAPFRIDPGGARVGATVDRDVLEDDMGPREVLEAKVLTYRSFTAVRREASIPPYMIFQGTTEAGVSEAPATNFSILHADSWRCLPFKLAFDQELYDRVRARADEWWERHIIREEPVPEREPTPVEDLPEATGEVILREDERFVELVQELLEARDIRDEAKAVYAAMKDEVKAAVGGFGIYQGGGARIYYSQRSGRKTRDWKALENMRPIDGALLQAELTRRLIEFPGIEEYDVLHLLQEIADDVRLDLLQFEKRGNPYEHFQPYRIKAAAE